jgi:lipid-binding SYLF domain-containing protein
MTQTHSARLTRRPALMMIAAGLGIGMIPRAARAASAQQLVDDSRAALHTLYAKSAKASELGKRAKAVLVFPTITKAGLIVGGQGGQGVLFVDGHPTSFHKIGAGSVGYQIGVQKFSYALFFMSPQALETLHKSDGWAVGTGPSLVVVDEGFAKSMNTTTLKKEVYAMSFGQRGLMAGAGLEGSRITQFTPSS